MKQELLEKIETRQARIGIVGLGYVGLPLAVSMVEAGFFVIGVDVDTNKVQALNSGQSYVEDVPSETVADMVDRKRFRATTNYANLDDVDAISICVPTPLNKTRDPDISYIVSAAESIAKFGSLGKLVILESTTYPGTTQEIILPALAKEGLEVGKDFFLAFSPERIDPGRTDYTVHTTPKVIGGITPACLDIAVELYGTFVNQPVPVSSPAAAEMVKLLENTFRAVNIGLVNEVAMMCDKLDLNVWEVVDAAATKPYGFMPFYPGPGLGGHCIPVDPHYLSWKLRTLNYTARFIELASEVNGQMPEYVVSKTADTLNDISRSVRNSNLLILGVAYKPNVGDVRESPALDIIHLLQEKGANVSYHDPYVADLSHEGFDLQCVESLDAAIDAADCVLIVTNHATYDWDMIVEKASLIVDTRNAIKSSHSHVSAL